MKSAQWKRVDKRISSGLLFLVLCALAGGCGKEKADISGKVTYRGKPLELGNVLVIASDSLAYSGEIQKDGSYTIKNVPVGPAKVSVSARDPKMVEEMRKFAMQQRSVGQKDGKEKPEPLRLDPRRVNLIPEIYGDPDHSGLTLEVRKGLTEYDVSLK